MSSLLKADYSVISELDHSRHGQDNYRTKVVVDDKTEVKSNFTYRRDTTVTANTASAIKTATSSIDCLDRPNYRLAVVSQDAHTLLPRFWQIKLDRVQSFVTVIITGANNIELGELLLFFYSDITAIETIKNVIKVFLPRIIQEFQQQYCRVSADAGCGIVQSQNEQLLLALTIYDVMTDGILVTDNDHNIIYANPAMEVISGYSREELMGCNPRILKSDKHTKSFYQNMWRTLNHTGEWQGELINQRKNGDTYPIYSLLRKIFLTGQHKATHIAVNRDISQEKETQRFIEFQAKYDSLTGLLNRYEFNRLINDYLTKSKAQESSWAFILLDIDDFKDINDSRGHLIGDQILTAVAKRLQNLHQPGNLLARLGGDEFGLFVQLTTENLSSDTIDKLVAIFKTPFKLADDTPYQITASVGVSLYPDDSTDAEQLYSQADQALYAAKGEGKNSLAFFTPVLHKRVLRQQIIKSRLKQAIQSKNIKPYFQPIVNIRTGKVSHCEALARWRDPELGQVSPDEFIRVAETYGLMPEIGVIVAEQAIATVAQLNRELGSPIGVSINRSPKEFIAKHRDPLVEFSKKYQMETQLIMVELTESLMVKNPERAKKELTYLHNQGFKLAMDDFGTGYSSLAYLNQFPFNVLKIDRAFIRDLAENGESYILVKTIIAMARNFKLTTVAEGVETEKQLEYLKLLGCDYAQGYLFSQALDAQEFSAYIRAKNSIDHS
ncbi:putative bifunctional diguanylate cyclase/phosphodiesterase [Halioxenophilus sp. WMMB6]|uniref:putative bifunctional diguanylate cyclase/phosphodiesterase n=1 Tax=Halioxenophilus sp. WMMB6 TaxID=3073815 RepID=UPI00295E3F1D|nr:EAL domain-containing protein [Halioxenophilus sp. WMMB6]